MYSNQYYGPLLSGLDMQTQELQRQRNQVQQLSSQLGQPSINQTFQIGTNNYDFIKYANDIDEVKKSYIIGDTPFFSKDMSIVWVKNTKGEVRTFELNEIVQKDEKDIQIEMLQAQLDEIKKEIRNEQSNKYVDGATKDKKSSSVQSISRIEKD